VRRAFLKLTFILLSPALTVSYAQTPERFDSGPYKGFIKSPTEHAIVELPDAIDVRSIQGSMKDPHNDALFDVSFEIRDETGTIRTGVSNSKGRFNIRGVPKGTYRFKATKDGFQSIVGTVVVNKTAPKNNTITLQLQLGV
jgi:hypothetical protein